MIPYTEKTYLFPPRPEHAITVDRLDEYESKGNWIAQVKKNGTCSVIFVSPDKTVTAMGRHRENHKAWQFTDKSRELFTRLPGNGWYVFVAELMHSKGNGIRDTNYVFDMLVEDGKYLIGENYAARYLGLKALLLPLREDRWETHSHHVLNKNTWLAKIQFTSYRKLFMSLDNNEDEGIVLKRMTDGLEIGSREKNNTAWNVKCRKVHKNFSC